MDTRSPFFQNLALVLIGILVLDPIVATAAQLAVDQAAGGNTQLGQAGNGVPVVNIATPDGSGLSHNRFREYNVGTEGLILNNATDRTQATQLGGLILGNPNLQGRAAATILNEVTGGNRSLLGGYTEVAGQSARVIVSNPHGLTCNGCGFINTPRATLTTGKPVLDAGRLARFQVDGGDIAIEGTGLNASNVDQFELITRSARINAELHAQRLDIVTGRNDVQADSLAATPRAADGSPAPALAIDSSALGGMYAGAIRLLGTEAGVGVKLAGDLAASAGDIRIDANGQVTLAQTAAAGDLQVKAQGAELTAKAYAGRSAVLETREDLAIRQSLAAKDAVHLDSGGRTVNQGVVEAGVNPDNSRNDRGDVQVRARDVRNTGSLVASRALDIGASQILDNQGGTLSAQGHARVSAGKLDNRQGRVLAQGDLALSAGELDNQAGLVNGAGKLEAQVGHLDNRGGELSSRSSARLQVGRVDNRGGKLIGEQALQLEASGTVNNQGGSLGANQQLQVKAASLDNSQQGKISSQDGLDVQVAGKLDNHGQGWIGANGAARVQAGSLDNRAGQLTSGSTLDLQAGPVDNRDAGRIASSGNLTASVAGLDQQGGGKLYSNSDLDLDLNGGTLNNSGGLLNAPGQLLLKSLGDVSNQGGEISSQRGFVLAARSLDNAGGKLLSAQALTLRIDQVLRNLKGVISAAALDVRSASLDNGGGLLTGTGDLLLKVAGHATNRSGEISSGGVTRLEATSLDNQGGDLLGDNGLVVSLGGALDNQGGTLGSGRDLELHAGSLDNRRGTLVADGRLNARVSGLLDNQDQGSLLAKGPVAIQAGRLDNRAGAVSGQGQLTIAGDRLDNRGGKLVANGPLLLDLKQLDNRQQGTISSKSSLTYQGHRLDNQGGRITAAGPLSLAADEVQNAQGRIASQGDLSAMLGTLAQQGGELVAQGNLQLRAHALDNRQGGLVGSTKALKLEVGDIDNRGGELSSQASVSIKGQRLDNSGGKLLAGTQLALAVDRLINQAKGLIFGRHATTLDAHSLDNSGGTLASATSLVIALAPKAGGLEGELVNRQGLISSEGSLGLQASRIDNQGGALSSAGDLQLTTAGLLDNQGGSIVSDGNLAVANTSLDNSEAGVLSAKGDARIDTGALNNRQGGKLTTAGTLDLHAGQVDNSTKGRIAGGQGLTARVTGLDQRDGGELFSKADLSLDLQQGLLNNSSGGLINSPGQLLLRNLGQVINRGGEISSQQGFTLAARQLDNSGGKLLSNQALVLRIAQALDNVKGTVSARGVDLRAGSLDNREGLLNSRDLFTLAVTGHVDNQRGALVANGKLDLTAGSLDNRVGEIAGKADVQTNVGTLDQRGGLLIAQGALTLKGQRLDNSANGLVGATRGLFIDVDEIDNRGGEISSQEAVQIVGGQLDNSAEGRLLAGTHLGLAVEHVINRAKGLISGKAGVDLTGSSLDNSGGRLLSQQAVAITLQQALANGQGLINSEGRLDLAVGSLDNSDGRVSSAGAMVLSSRGALGNDGGQLLTDSTLALSGDSLSNRQGVLSAKGKTHLTTGRLDNSQGQLTSADALDLTTGELINHDGRIGSHEALSVSARSLAQQGGQLFSHAGLSLDLNGGDLDNRQGLINAPGQLLLQNLGKVDNRGGELSSQEAFTLAARSLDNASGKLLGARALSLRIDQALANLKGLIAAASLDVAAASLANAGGTLTSRSDTRVNIGGALANDQQGLINAAQRLSLRAGSLDNRGGSLLAGSALDLRAQAVDNRENGLINSQGELDLQAGTLDSSQGGEVSAKGALHLFLDRLIQRQGRLIGASGLTLDLHGGDLDNQGGLILAQGPLSLQRLRDLANQGGEISSSESFVLDLRDLDNSGGKLISSGQLGLSGAQLRNQGGLLSGWQGLGISAQSLDNRNLGTLSSRDGNLSVTLSGALQNSGEGALVSQGRLGLKAASLDNSNKGILSSGGDQQLDVTNLLDNSAGGQIDSGAKLTLKAASLNNVTGTVQAQQALTLDTASLDNRAGNIAGNAALTLNLLGAFANANGKLASVGPLLLQGATQVDNQNGQIVSQGLLTLLAGQLDNRNRGTVAANGTLLLTATGAVQNDNDGLLYSRDAGVRIQSASLDNTGGTLQSQGDLAIATGAFSNLGGRVISEAGHLDLNADNLDNRGGTLASLEGWVKLRLSGWLSNALLAGQGGVVQGQSLDLTAAAVANQGGHLSALSGNVLLSVASLDNSQGALFAKQLLKLSGHNLTNAGQIAAGTVDFSLAGALNNQAGIIESDSSLTLAAASLDNRGGQLRSLATSGRTQLTVQGLLDNRYGTLETANSDFGLVAGSFLNVGGKLLHVGSGAFDIALPGVVHAGGSIVTNGGLTLTADSWTNSTVIQAGRLTVNVGQFHQTASGQLLASSTFTGSGGNWSNDGLIASDGALSLALSGGYSGSGRVTSLGDLGFSAAQLTLPTAGRITGGGNTNVWVGGLFSNSGVMTSASGLTVNAGQLNNYGTLGSAEQLRLVTPSLLNQNGLIFSGGDMALRVGSFTNLYADVFSLGSLDVALNDAGDWSQRVENASGTLESAGDMFIRASNIENKRDVVGGVSELVSSAIGIRCATCIGVSGSGPSHLVWMQKYHSTVSGDTSAAANIISGRDLIINGGELVNIGSSISAVRDGNINLARFKNQGIAFGDYTVRQSLAMPDALSNYAIANLWLEVFSYNSKNDELYGGGVVNSAGNYRPRVHYWDMNYTENSVLMSYRYGSAKNDPFAAYLTIGSYGPVDIGDTVMDNFLRAIPQPNYQPGNSSPAPGFLLNASYFDEVITYDSPSSFTSAVVQVGGSLLINASQELSNSVIREGEPISRRSDRTGSTHVASHSSTVVAVNAQLPPDLAQQQVNPLALPGFSIPTGSNSLFRLSGTNGSEAQADQVSQGPQNWTLGGASISLAEREQVLTDTQARQVQVNDAGQAIIGGRQLELGDRLRTEGAGIGAIQVEAGDAPSGFAVPDRSSAAGGASQGGDIAQQHPSDGSQPQGQSIARVQGLPGSQVPTKPHKYLVETNPELTNLKQFLSSDYLLGRLGYDPDQAQKRLGDGLYEQRLVREAIAARTGQRFLDGLASDEAMFRYLMDNAIASKQQLGLSVGVGLSAAQVAALTHDIVWMEEHEVNGEKVLVPVLYLAQADGRLAPNGALIQGKDVTLISGGELANQGTLRASDNLSATGKNLVNSGLIEAGNRLDLLATDSIRNAQGGIIAGRDVSAIALSGDIINERSVTSLQGDSPSHQHRDNVLDAAARIEAANGLSLSAGRDLSNIGSVISAGGDAAIKAGRDLLISSVVEVDSTEGRSRKLQWSETTITQHGSDLQVGGDLKLDAGRDLSVIASRVGAGNDLSMAAGRDLSIESAANESHSAFKSRKVTSSSDQVLQQSSTIEAGGDLSLKAGQDLTLLASRVVADENVDLDAGRDVNLLSAKDESASYYSKKSKGSFGRSKSVQQESYDSTNVASVVEAGKDLSINTSKAADGGLNLEGGRDVSIIGSQLKAGDDLLIGATGDVAVLSGVEEHGSYSKKTKSGFLGMSSSGKSQLKTTATQVASELEAGNDLVVAAGNDVRLRASEAAAGNDVELRAGLVQETGDINLVSANDTAYSLTEQYKNKVGISSSGGFISVVSAHKAGQEAQSSTSVGSQVLADRDATLQAERDINVIGSGISAGRNVSLDAGRDVNVVASGSSSSQRNWEKNKQVGVSVSGDDNGVSVFVGGERISETDRRQQDTAAASQISAGNDLDIKAGRDLNQSGSDLSAVRDINLQAGRDVNIDAARERLLTEQERTEERQGLGATVNHNFGNTKDAVSNAGNGDNNVSKGSSVLQAVDRVSQFLAGPTADVRLGNSKQSSSQQVIEETNRASSLNAGNDLNIIAGNDVTVRGSQLNAGRDINVKGRDITLDVAQGSNREESKESQSWGGVHGGTTGGFKGGVGGRHGVATEEGRQGTSTPTQLTAGRDVNLNASNDLAMIGTQAQAGRDIDLKAGNDLTIRAAQNASQSESDRRSGGGEVGITLGSEGFGVYSSVSRGKGNLDREGERQQEAYLYAGDRLKFSSGQDTTIAGAELRGHDVIGRVGGDLAVSSLPDTGGVKGKEFDLDATITIGPGGGGISGSVGKGKTNGSTYWVEEQTRITAKDRVDIRTENHTQIDGAVIASDSGNLKLDTGSLDFSDIAGHDKEHSYYLNVGGTYELGSGPTQQDPSQVGKGTQGENGWSVSGYEYEKEREQIVRATVGEGEIIVRDDASTGKDSTAGLNRDVDKAYEITKDEEERTDLYVSKSSLQQVEQAASRIANEIQAQRLTTSELPTRATQALGEERALAIGKNLVRLGLDPSMMEKMSAETLSQLNAWADSASKFNEALTQCKAGSCGGSPSSEMQGSTGTGAVALENSTITGAAPSFMSYMLGKTSDFQQFVKTLPAEEAMLAQAGLQALMGPVKAAVSLSVQVMISRLWGDKIDALKEQAAIGVTAAATDETRGEVAQLHEQAKKDFAAGGDSFDGDPYVLASKFLIDVAAGEITGLGKKAAGTVFNVSAGGAKEVPSVKWSAQEKHFPGHNSYTPGRSILTSDPRKLAESAGSGTQVGDIPVGMPGSKERVNFGAPIGTYIDGVGAATPTSNGIIHYSKDGIHIVPARP